MFSHRKNGPLLRPTLPPRAMPEFDPKRSPEQRSTNSNNRSATDAGGEKVSPEPEAFGRSVPPVPGPVTEAFGRAEAPTRPAPNRPQRPGRPDDHPKPASSEEQNGETDVAADNKDNGADKPSGDEPAKPPFYKRPILMTVVVAVVLAVVIGVLLWWLHARKFESTDDGFIA